MPEILKKISKKLSSSSPGTSSAPRVSALGRIEEMIQEQRIDRNSLPEITPSKEWWDYVPRLPRRF